MKITFKGDSLLEILAQMEQFMGTPVAVMADVDLDVPVEVEEEAPKPEPKKRKSRAKPKPATEDGGDVGTPAGKTLTKAEVEEDVKADVDPAEAKKTALSILMEHYTVGGETRDKVKDLLTVFGVDKFSEIPEDQGEALLKRAEQLKEECA